MERDQKAELVSVVIPCYNAEAYVGEAIESALRQTHEPTEVIVIDDGSTDGSLDVIRSFGDQITWRTGENRGACHARNRGLDLARGKYVQFLDADDVLRSGKIEHQMQLIRERPLLPDLIAASYKKKTLDGRERVVEVEEQDEWMSLIKKRLGITSSNLWRRAFVEKVDGWSEAMPSSQEAELMFRMLQEGACVAYDDACYTIIRQREGSISTSEEGEWKPEKRARYFRLRKEIIQYLHQNGLLTGERKTGALDTIFRQIRQLYEYDPASAIRLHRQVIPADFRPRPGFNAPPYIYCYRLLGFTWAQKIKHIISTLEVGLQRVYPKKSVSGESA